jgi:Tfp pilus assembly protein PilX
MPMIFTQRARARARTQEGFSLIVVLSVMLVTSLLLVASFAAANGDLPLTQEGTHHSQAYYAALAGVQEYDYKLQDNPDYWESCKGPAGEVEGAHFEVQVLPATGAKECNPSTPFTTAIEAKGALANTFRIESTACVGAKVLTTCEGSLSATVQKRSVVATFQVTGFLDYAYFTQYEDEDYYLYGGSQEECERYYAARKGGKCHEIEFAEEDSVHGPMHTDDAANICGKVEFGRKGHEPPDAVEINGGTTILCDGSDPIFNTANGKYSVGKVLQAPESDSSLKLYVESQNEFEGLTHLVLNGSANTIEVVNASGKKTIPWPENGLIYVQKAKTGACTYEYKQVEADLANEAPEEEGCGSVYVSGTYSKSLTIAAERELIINGNLIPTGVTPGEAPTGTETLGLIATHYVRIYHPVAETYTKGGGGCESHNPSGQHTFKDPEIKAGVCEYTNEYYAPREEYYCDAPNATGYLASPWIYAAILSTSHSFLVDNFDCGSTTQLGKLDIYGAIAQKFRGIVGQPGEHGYVKNYNYDERLATDEPPYFLAPLKAGWKIIRETAPEQG